MVEMSGYSADHVGDAGLPRPVRRGRWWVHEWTLEASVALSLDEFVPPAPLLELEASFVSMWFSEERGLISVFEELEVISVPAFVYASQVAIEIERLLGGVELIIDGRCNHQLLGIVRHERLD
ncbi:hypothetical protein [Actinomadura sp. WMMB 499]|uniref:hypothetical protein n=1 Tax=Actinomadura sp. WMMB 499 TaxID=1219491 RepID=UPI001244CAE0|nr:hypothetical protein [Actinomadura sp. WMMB 499]QFG25013.1 hypothetical protein F7P10_31640 [Actinomadura sp. WMMB 499]